MQAISELFALEQVAPDRFVAPNGKAGWITQYGGQIVAQALAAATATVDGDRKVNSLHAYFLRPGAFDVPIDIVVERERDGGSFANRRAVASQAGKPILSLAASYHCGEKGPARQTMAMPAVPNPEGLPLAQDAPEAYGRDPSEPSPLSWIEVRPAEGGQPFADVPPEAPRSVMWVRFRDSGQIDGSLDRTLIAYLSDLFLINTGLQPHRADIGRKSKIASIDHSVWFHADPPMEEWMLVIQESNWADGGRVMLNATILTQDGRMVATVAQEGLLRLE